MDTLIDCILQCLREATWTDLDAGTYGAIARYSTACSDEEWRHFLRCRHRFDAQMSERS